MASREFDRCGFGSGRNESLEVRIDHAILLRDYCLGLFQAERRTELLLNRGLRTRNETELNLGLVLCSMSSSGLPRTSQRGHNRDRPPILRSTSVFDTDSLAGRSIDGNLRSAGKS
jgi:hypothetical protein